MKPKDKAIELENKFFSNPTVNSIEQSKSLAEDCAWVVLNEIDDIMRPNPLKQYWYEVIEEIRKL